MFYNDSEDNFKKIYFKDILKDILNSASFFSFYIWIYIFFLIHV